MTTKISSETVNYIAQVANEITRLNGIIDELEQFHEQIQIQIQDGIGSFTPVTLETKYVTEMLEEKATELESIMQQYGLVEYHDGQPDEPLRLD